MLCNVVKDINLEQHFGMKRFFIKFMINTLCNMFPPNFGRNSLVCGSYMRALEKKIFELGLGDSFVVSLSIYNTLNIKNLMHLYLDDVFQ
jgi:hypothetical protein